MGARSFGSLPWQEVVVAMLQPVPFDATDYIELFYDIFEVSSDAIFIARLADGTILDANHSALSLFGYSRPEAIGHSTLELGLWASPAEREGILDALRETGLVRRYPVRFRTKWSEEFSMILSAKLAKLRGDDVVLGVGVLSKR
jgi:PAS domain S-box-containing protein